jgi:hypothetical protein
VGPKQTIVLQKQGKNKKSPSIALERNNKNLQFLQSFRHQPPKPNSQKI